MAGIEQVVVHSKSYVIRWIQVPEHHSISWSVQPQKKSINFGIFRHPGTKNGLAPNLPTHDTLDQPPTPALGPPALPTPGTPGSSDGMPPKMPHRPSVSKPEIPAVVEKLQGIGMKPVLWSGKCEADKVTMGRYDVAEGAGGMYGLVFDNTFSKQTGKTVTFVLLTHPTDAAPKSGHHLHYSQAFTTSGDAPGKKSAAPSAADSTESLPHDPAAYRATIEDPRPLTKGGHGVESKGLEGSNFYTGVLNKKRRKKGQGYAKRFFSLDLASSTLSYYQNRHSSALRGAVPLSLAAIGANEKNREFSVDSGAEVWHLKATNKKDFEGWRDALEKASALAAAKSDSGAPRSTIANTQDRPVLNPAEEHEWARVEKLVSKVAGTRDAVRGLAKDTDTSPLSGPGGAGLGVPPSDGHEYDGPQGSSLAEASNPYFPEVDDKSSEKRPFWKRKGSALQRKTSSPLGSTSPPMTSPAGSTLQMPRPKRSVSEQLAAPPLDVHDRCLVVLQDLNNTVASFSALIAESKARRRPALPTTSSRISLDSASSQEFFDAEDPGTTTSQLLTIRRSNEFEDSREAQVSDGVSDADSDGDTDAGDTEATPFAAASKQRQSTIFPSIQQTLPPLPLPPVKRRATVKPPKQPPPSIIGFLRKNAGKDLSTVSMPVTANEPTSLLQRLAEGLEYTHLLDSATSAATPPERLMYVAAFAVSGFAYNRVKERALRKPFNPMLGETYELVREDLGYRFVAEKVSHHPVRAACQADSLTNGGWSFAHSPQPVQKFWGKSVELNTEGRARVVLNAAQNPAGKGELFSWSPATCFLRNVIAGEKYVEPVQTMTVVHEASGARAVAAFKAGGMFSGRSEDVTVELFGPAASGDSPLPLGLTGKWTESLKRTDTGATVWKAGPIVPDAAKVYGFTTFAATLNEVTANEDGALPPTDSRLRPDQRALELGDADKAEALKARLEERQRARRKVSEGHGQKWRPQFFELTAGGGGGEGGEEEIWRLKEKHGYWERRVQGDWSGVDDVFET